MLKKSPTTQHECAIYLEKSVRLTIGLYHDKYCVKSFGKTPSFS